MIFIFVFLGAFIAWAVLHSIMASITAKQSVRAAIGEAVYAGWYRLFYNVFAVVTFLPVYVLVPRMPQAVLWAWPRPYLILAICVQVIGLVGLFVSVWVTGIWDFLGVQQVLWHIRNKQAPLKAPQFITSGPYALVRHPLYFFALLLLWFNSVMTIGSFIFYTAVTAYFWFGTYYEEKKLAADFGAPYQAYQQRVPRLIPFIRFRRSLRP